MTGLRRIQYNSPVVLTFFLISGLALVAGLATGGESNRLLFMVYRAPLTDPLSWMRMVTHVLGHDGYQHFLGNMMLLLVVGPPLEERYGSTRLLLAIGVTALVSGLVQVLFSSGGLLGASGIVFMMILLASVAGMKEGRIPLTLILVALLYLGGEVFSGLFEQDRVSQLTHILGGLCGGGLGMLFLHRESRPKEAETPAA